MRSSTAFRFLLLIAALFRTAASASAQSPLGDPSLLPLAEHAQSVVIADVTGDGLNDVVIGTDFCGAACSLLVLPQTSVGSLDSPRTYPAPAGRVLTAGDMDGDGRNDVLMTAYGPPEIFLQNAAGELEDRRQPAPFRATAALTSGDLNGDGRLDVVAVSLPESSPAPLVLDLFRQTGKGTFSRQSLVLDPWEWSGRLQPQIHDLDGDGRADILIFDPEADRLLFLYQQPNGGFARDSLELYDQGVVIWQVRLGNFDQDPLLEILASGVFLDPTAKPHKPLFRIEQTSPRHWTLGTPDAMEFLLFQIATGDLDDDGRDDVVGLAFDVLGKTQAMVLLQEKGGGLRLVQHFETPFGNFLNPQTIAIGDINGDDLADVAIADDNAGLITLLHKGHDGPTPQPELFSPSIPDFAFTVRISSASATPPLAGRLEASCIPETVCVSGAVPGRSEVFLRVVGPKPNGRLWPTLVKFSTSQVDVWVYQISTGAVRHYRLAGASGGHGELPGLFDRHGFEPMSLSGAEVAFAEEGEVPPPPDEVFTSAAIPGFRFRARISTGGAALNVRQEAGCIEETLCLSGAVPGRSEVFLRIVGPKPNGRLWPTIVKFTTSTLEVWIEQVSSGETKYYRIEGAAPGQDDLTGLFDRQGFPR